MRKILSYALAAVLAMAVPAVAQTGVLPYRVVVSDCSTIVYTPVGKVTPTYVDTTGKVCGQSPSAGPSSQLPAALGQNVGAQSLAVVLNSDPDTRANGGNITVRDTGSVVTSGQNSSSVITGTPTAGSFQTFAINGQSSVGVLVSGTWTGTLEFDLSFDGGVTYFPSTMRVRGVSYAGASITANGNFSGDVSSATHFRVRAIAVMTGTATVKPVFSATSGPVQILNPVRIFDGTSGATQTIKPASTQASTADTSFPVQSISGSTGLDYSANKPTLPNVGANFAASGPYASYVLIATRAANPARANIDIENTSGAQIAIIRDDGTAAGAAAPVNASVFSLAGGSSSGAQGGSWSSSTFKGRIQIYALSSAAIVAVMED